MDKLPTSIPTELPPRIAAAPPAKNPKRRRWLVALLIVSNVLAIGIPLTLELTGGDSATDIGDIPLRMNYLFAAFGCFVIALLAEWIRYMAILKSTCGKFCPWVALQISIIGRYYDSITPSGAGGQPFQIYYLNKEGISKGASATVPIAAFSLNQFAFVIIALAVMVCGYKLDSNVLMISACIGLLLYFAIPFAIISVSLMPGKLSGVLRWICKALNKLRIIKNPDEKFETWSTTVHKYQNALVEMKKHMFLLIMSLLFSIVYFAAILSIPFYVLKAFGANVTFITMFATNTLIYCAISIIPTPGNAGAAEGLFYRLFKVISPGYVFWAMLIWRFFCYYGFIISGLVVFIVRMFKAKSRAKDYIPAGDV